MLVIGVLDGDSFKARVEVWPGQYVETTVRVTGIDTPEIRGKCEQEKRAARAAQLRLAEVLVDGKVILSSVKLDKYASRIDATVTVDGRPVAQTMITEGHARAYAGGTRGSWCNG